MLKLIAFIALAIIISGCSGLAEKQQVGDIQEWSRVGEDACIFPDSNETESPEWICSSKVKPYMVVTVGS